MKAQVYKCARRIEGVPNNNNIALVEEDLPDLNDGDVLFKAVYLSVDPYMRTYMNGLPLKSVMVGDQVCRVAESKNPKYPVGSHYLLSCGWRSHTVLNPNSIEGHRHVKPIPSVLDGLPLSLAFGPIGMPGAAAYFALFKVLQVQPGKTLLVASAAGAIGQVACQLAKLQGCKVIGCAGTTAKCDFVKTLGVDVAFNYKYDDVDEQLKGAAPNGIDYYLDCIGGTFTNNIIKKHMASFGQIVVLSQQENTNSQTFLKGEIVWKSFLMKRLTMRGMQVYDYSDKEWNEAFEYITTLIKEDKLTNEENITEGFVHMRRAFYEVFTEDHFGKSVVKVSETNDTTSCCTHQECKC